MIGKTLSHYQILERLGEGGMGVVYKAHDTKLDRTVALKVLASGGLHSEEARRRFHSEARAAAALDHPNVCAVHEIGEAGGQSFIVMSFVDGQVLAERIRQGPLPLDQLLGIAVQVGDGLEAAHEKGIVHRDIKAGNVLLTASGVPKIADFGLAKHLDRTALTQEGVVLGTLSYMSPEQAEGIDVDQRTDIWSFGVLLYEMSTGKLPFVGAVPQAVINSILHTEQEPITALRTGFPVMLERVIFKALRKNSQERYQHVGELVVDLRAIERETEFGSTQAYQSAPIHVGNKAFNLKSLASWVGGTLLTIFLIYQIAGIISADRSGDDVPSIAVFPFENSRKNPELEWLSEELSRTLTYRLSLMDSVQVIDRLQILKALKKAETLQAGLSDQMLARESLADLQVTLAVVGSYAVYGDSLRVLASLVQIQTGVTSPLLEETYPSSDFLGMQEDAARSIITRITRHGKGAVEQ